MDEVDYWTEERFDEAWESGEDVVVVVSPDLRIVIDHEDTP